MISLNDYSSLDGLGLAALVERKEVTPKELKEAALAGIAKVNPKLNAVLQTLPALADAEIAAGLPKGPFTGVPFVIKELIVHAKNVRCDMGSKLTQGFVPKEDTELMARFRRAGIVLVGTTQTPEFGYNPTTETTLFGPVHNPWMQGRSAGGSSGGSGAAVAAGIVPIAHANDGGGSIRIPASCNGLVGLKPTRDRVPTGPDYADPLCGLAIEFIVSRSVRDSAAMLDAVAGADVGAPGLLAPPARPYMQEVGAAPGKLRIAWTTTPASGEKIDPECVNAVHETVKLLEDLGHTLVEDRPVYDWETFLRNVHVIWTAFTASSIDAAAADLGRKPSQDNLEAVTLACYEDGKARTATELISSMGHGNTLSRLTGAFFQKYDLHVTPTIARPPAAHGEINQNREAMTAMEWTRHVFAYCPFTPLFNSTGQPAISLPLYWSAAGLPIGVQFAGRFGDEASLLRIASQLEQARPWAAKKPPLHVSK
ncbi:MAG: amidase [Candidatus Binatus sp.]|uniref:amidase n=1 Tax=Candidatus Binatus sp. TaxID=2811406 RepID=UPI0027282411|nr:amidase [Candidatus Binatus sp.]MDO8432038.1 amidase [Candidatus Binatus sp.]